MNSNSTNRMPILAGVGLAMAALLLLLPAPVHADTLNATDDTYIDDGKPGKNFGSSKKVKIRDGSSKAGLFKFDLSALGAATGDDIDTATLRVYIKKLKIPGFIDLHVVTTPWTEGAVTSGTAPTLAALFATVAIPAGSQGSWILIDVTTEVKDWLDGTPNDGIAILPTPASGIRMVLDSKEAKSKPLELEVTHNTSAIIDAAVNEPQGSPIHPHKAPCILGGGESCDDHPHDEVGQTGAHPHGNLNTEVGLGNHQHADLGAGHPHGPISTPRLIATIVTSPSITIPAFGEASLLAICPSGRIATGGGYALPTNNALVITTNIPSANHTQPRWP